MNNKELTLWDIIEIIRKRWWVVVVLAVGFGAISFLYSKYTYVEIYTVRSQYYVNKAEGDTQTSTSSSAVLNELNYSMKIMNTYMQILRTNSFQQNVADRYNKEFATTEAEKITPGQVGRSIAMAVIEDTKMFNLAVSARNPKVAYNIAKAIEIEAPLKIAEVMAVEDSSLTVADKAVETNSPSNSDNKYRNAAIGVLVGIALAIGIIVLIELLDSRVKSAEELTERYNLPILGSIPGFGKGIDKKRIKEGTKK